jgi:hypothetical protein
MIHVLLLQYRTIFYNIVQLQKIEQRKTTTIISIVCIYYEKKHINKPTQFNSRANNQLRLPTLIIIIIIIIIGVNVRVVFGVRVCAS